VIKDIGLVLEELVRQDSALPERAHKDLEKHINDYKRLILKMAHKYVRNRVEYEDLAQEAMIGLIQADRDFDPTRSSDFHTYAVYRMKGKMYEYCISNDSPIYAPTHITKAASYVKQMRRLLENEPYVSNSDAAIEDIIRTEEHPEEKKFPVPSYNELREIKRKLGRIAINSSMRYEKLANLALLSLSLVVSDEILTRLPETSNDIEKIILCEELRTQMFGMLREKQRIVLEMRAQDWSYREIAEYLYELGYKNRRGGVISRQAVKSIYDDCIRSIRKSKIYRDFVKDSGNDE